MAGLPRSLFRDAPPTHFSFKIESFSSLSKLSFERYESCEFDAADSKWKLALYPTGNKKRNVKNHISLYLLSVDNSCIDLSKEIQVTFSLFVFDHIRDKYMSIQELSRFHAMKSESGFDKFLPLKIFKDPAKGYLMDDTCVFGAEVFLITSTITGQCLTMAEKRKAPFKHTWKVEKFSEMEDRSYYSDTFTTSGHSWKIMLYPKGSEEGSGNSLTLSLYLADAENVLSAGTEVLVQYRLRVVDQVNKRHREIATAACLSSSKKGWGWPEFLPLSDLNSSTGYLVNDTCIVEAEVVLLGSAKKWG